MTKPPLIVVCPLLPPQRGGLPDHTARLAAELSREFTVTVITSRSAASQPAFQVSAVVDDWSKFDEVETELRRHSSSTPIVWQYVPHMYGRGGVNRALPRFVEKLRRQGRKQVVIAHEIAAGLSWKPHWLWFALNHRWQWRKLAHAADLVPISTERWVEIWADRMPACADKFFCLPSPSSIPRQPSPTHHRLAWRDAHRLTPDTRILAYFGTVSAAKQLPWVTAAWEQAQDAKSPLALAIIGAAPDLSLSPKLQSLYRPLGYLSAQEVSAALSAADVLCLPFVDGVSERRTTFMAGLDHGLAISTTVGHNTGATLRKAGFISTANADYQADFTRNTVRLVQDESRIAQLSVDGKRAHDRDYGWQVVVQRLVESMRRRRII
ncbi:MAG TPA: hypothetical protein VMF06_04980 [Candidatus Limnocylindria bacterium]|nr:hypothetical protein [Candidatus Limnocylindria bacterium]